MKLFKLLKVLLRLSFQKKSNRMKQSSTVPVSGGYTVTYFIVYGKH